MVLVDESLDLDYDMKKFSDLQHIYGGFEPSVYEIETAFGNTGTLVDMKFNSSSQKARDLLCVFIVFQQLDNLLVEPLTAKTYTQFFRGYSDNKEYFINWIINTIIVKPEYNYYTRHIRDTLEWNLKRVKGPLILDNQIDFMDIIDPRPQNGASKRKRKSKKSRRSQKKRKGARKTKRQRTTKTK
jgi:hypothetical protein